MDISSENQRYALFATTSDNFFAGTCVALASFLDHNSWFDGDIILASNNLSDDRADFLQNSFDNLMIQEINPELLNAVKGFSENFPKMGERVRIFYNLQAFLQTGYARLLKIDADMIFRGDLYALFLLNSLIAGSPAMPMYRGQSRSFVDFSLVEEGDSNALAFFMNAGLYSVSQDCLNPSTFVRLLSYVNVDTWSSQRSNHTDQAAINLYFNGQIEALSPIYNYLVPYESEIRNKMGLNLRDALVWHFNDHQKPWLLNELLAPGKRVGINLQAQQEWLTCYTAFMQRQNLRSLKWV